MRHPMRAATAPQSLSAASNLPPAEQPHSLRAVRISIWIYVILLVIEGALRKWALPSLSDPLLVDSRSSSAGDLLFRDARSYLPK